MNLRQIEVFRAVMLAGSVTGAARLLHVSQPGVSRMLGHIETQLGFRLFERGRGRLRPTPEAEALYAEVEQVYQGVQRIDTRARELKEGAGLTLRVLASPAPALEVVPRALAELADKFPAARLYLETQWVREMVDRLVRHEADVAISTLPVENALLASEVVGSWSLVAVFAAGHRFAAQRTVHPRDVLAERLVGFSADTPQGRWIADWCREHQVVPDARIEVRAGQTACAVAAAGAGVAIVDDLTARASEGGRLQFRPLARAPTFEVHAVRHAGAPPSVLAQAFVERVRAAFRKVRRNA